MYLLAQAEGQRHLGNGSLADGIRLQHPERVLEVVFAQLLVND